MNNTTYKFAYYYTTGDGSNDSESYTSKEEALKDFKEFVNDEIIEDFDEEDNVIDYAVIWAEDSEDEEADVENILFWTFEHGYTEFDPPCKD
jgi:hypothetical protein